MMQTKILKYCSILLTILILLSSCTVIVNRYRTRDGRKRFVKSNFEYYDPNFNLPTVSLIKTNGIYCEENTKYPYQGVSRFIYWRFYPKGQFSVYVSNFGPNEIDSLDFKMLKHFEYGYFKLAYDTLLTESDDNCNPQFLKSFDAYHIKNDSIRWILSKKRMGGTIPFTVKYNVYYHKDTNYYVFKNLNLELNDLPNW